MRLSAEYIACCRRIAELKRHLLPYPFDATGTYSDEDYDKTRAFIALVHAEIEYYIEQRVLTVVAQCVDHWMKRRVPGSVVFALYAMCYSGWSELGEDAPETPKKLSTQGEIEPRLASAREQYRQVVLDNHGIKEANLKRLLIPLSVRIDKDLNNGWIGDMSSFGTNRGQIAHQSFSTYNQPDPKSYWETIARSLLPGLKALDKVLTGLT